MPRSLSLAGAFTFISRALAMAIAVSGIASLFVEWVAWSSFFTVLVDFYRKFTYPMYELISRLISFPIPSAARDVYSISYSIAVCMFLARGFSSGWSAMIGLAWQAANKDQDAVASQGIVQRVLVALIGSLIVAFFAPGLLLLSFFHPKTRPWGLDALRVYVYAISTFVLLALLNFQFEQYVKNREGLASWIVPIINEPIVKFVLYANACAVALLLFFAAGTRLLLSHGLTKCVMNIAAVGQYQLAAENGLVALISNLPLTRRVRYAVPRLNSELDFFVDDRQYIRLGDKADPMSRQAMFLADRLVIIEMLEEAAENCRACIVPVIQRNRALGTLSKKKIESLPSPLLFDDMNDLMDAEPRLQGLIEKARAADRARME
jgi:hypothetical protein